MNDSQDYAIIVDSVSKTFQEGFLKRHPIQALKGINLKIPSGELFGLLGPNGAGKTTLINICATLLIPETGQVSILGKKLNALAGSKLSAIKARLNMCSGNPNFPWCLTVYELLSFYARLYGLNKNQRKRNIQECLELLELDKVRNMRFDRLSSGTKQKLALAKSLINDPALLFLDEPTLGLDPDIAQKIRSLIRRIHREKKKTIVLTTHYMKEAEELCQRIAFIKQGEIIALGTSQTLKNQTNSKDLEEVFLELAH